MGLALFQIGWEKGSGSGGQSCELVSTFTANPHVIDMTTGAVLPSFSSESSQFEATGIRFECGIESGMYYYDKILIHDTSFLLSVDSFL